MNSINIDSCYVGRWVWPKPRPIEQLGFHGKQFLDKNEESIGVKISKHTSYFYSHFLRLGTRKQLAGRCIQKKRVKIHVYALSFLDAYARHLCS